MRWDGSGCPNAPSKCAKCAQMRATPCAQLRRPFARTAAPRRFQRIAIALPSAIMLNGFEGSAPMEQSAGESEGVRGETRAQCALCRQMAILQRSHLLPRSLYKTVRGLENNPHPLHISPERWQQSSQQDTATLLCVKCEQQFHRQGENWVLRHLLRNTGHFKLLDLVNTFSQSSTTDRRTVYLIDSNAPIRFDALAYFAASVIWKASVHQWQSYEQGQSICLGHTYQEQFRLYLLGQAAFPDDAVLVLDVTRPENRLKEVLCSPVTARGDRHYRHWFMTPGVIFEIAVGRLMPSAVRNLCALRNRLIFSSNHEESMRQVYRSMSRSGRIPPQ